MILPPQTTGQRCRFMQLKRSKRSIANMHPAFTTASRCTVETRPSRSSHSSNCKIEPPQAPCLLHNRVVTPTNRRKILPLQGRRSHSCRRELTLLSSGVCSPERQDKSSTAKRNGVIPPPPPFPTHLRCGRRGCHSACASVPYRRAPLQPSHEVLLPDRPAPQHKAQV